MWRSVHAHNTIVLVHPHVPPDFTCFILCPIRYVFHNPSHFCWVYRILEIFQLWGALHRFSRSSLWGDLMVLEICSTKANKTRRGKFQWGTFWKELDFLMHRFFIICTTYLLIYAALQEAKSIDQLLNARSLLQALSTSVQWRMGQSSGVPPLLTASLWCLHLPHLSQPVVFPFVGSQERESFFLGWGTFPGLLLGPLSPTLVPPSTGLS